MLATPERVRARIFEGSGKTPSPLPLSAFDRAVILASPARYPLGPSLVAEQCRSRGVEPEVFLSAPASETASISRIGADGFAMLHPDPPPEHSTYPGIYWQGLAFLEIIRRAERDGVRRLLLLEDDCELTADFDRVVRECPVPDDWELLYYGAYHNWSDTEEVHPHLLRLAGSAGIHCVGFEASTFERLLRLSPRETLDDQIARMFHGDGRSYAIWPSVAVQRDGVSAITGEPTGTGGWFASKGLNWRTVAA